MLRVVPLSFLAAFLFTACDSSDPGDESATVATANSTVTVAYEGRLEDGTVFDRSDRTTFPLNRTIPGFRDNVAGMEIGEQKTFDVAPEDGYGAAGVTNPSTGEVVIPPNATLTFDVELLGIE